MIEKLADLDEKISHLEGQLSDPSLLSDQKAYQKVAQDHSHFSKLQRLYNENDALTEEIADNREMLHAGDDDPELLEMVKDEIADLENRRKTVEQNILLLLLPRDPNDERNTFLEIRAGTGGDEAALFVADMFRMYSRYAESQGWKVEVITSSPLGIGGFKDIIALIKGDSVYSKLKYESGVHRVQRVPATETQGRIHTSAVTVAILPEVDEVELNIDPRELKFDVYRASGPGGQCVNTTDSAVRITHLPTGLVVICQDQKSQHKNKAKALTVLRARLLDKMEQERHDKISAERRSQVGSGDRSERIRTYNFPQGRLTDHRINLTLYKLEAIIGGKLDDVLNPLISHDQEEKLKKIQ
jgi:peptide chain release factor 1